MFGGIEEVRSNHRIPVDALQWNPIPFQNNPVIFDVLTHLLDFPIFQNRPQLFQPPGGEVAEFFSFLVAKRNIESLMWGIGQTDPNESATWGKERWFPDRWKRKRPFLDLLIAREVHFDR